MKRVNNLLNYWHSHRFDLCSGRDVAINRYRYKLNDLGEQRIAIVCGINRLNPPSMLTYFCKLIT